MASPRRFHPLPQQPAPPVIINQYVPEPGPTPPAQNSTVQVYQAPTSPQPEPAEPQRPMIFIALKDGWVYTASDYGVERRTLHYITTQGTHSQVSLDLVDREKSARLKFWPRIFVAASEVGRGRAPVSRLRLLSVFLRNRDTSHG